MNIKVLLAALVGSVVLFLSGWVLYGMVFKSFFDANTVEGAAAVMRGDENMHLWAVFTAGIAWNLLLALVFSRYASISTFMGGAKTGAWLFLLIALGADLYSFAMLNISTLTATLVDPVINAVQGMLCGGAVGWALGYRK